MLPDGRDVPLPDLDTAGEGFDFRKWLADQGPGEMVGPQVRAAGRIETADGKRPGTGLVLVLARAGTA